MIIVMVNVGMRLNSSLVEMVDWTMKVKHCSRMMD